MKKLVKVMLAVVLILTVAAIFFACNKTSNELDYTLSDDGTYYIVSGCRVGTETDIIIPSVYKNLPVKGIGNYAFKDCIDLTSIIISASIESIGKGAFRNCSGLTSITIPDSVISIGENTFSSCSSLIGITIGNSVTNIGNNAFYSCATLTEINYNAVNCNDLSYGNDVFSYAGQSGEGITVNIGKDVTKIPAYLFRGGKITSVVFAEGSVCESIGDHAFENCSSLTSINIPASVTSIDDGAFFGCSKLTSITFEDTTTWYRTNDSINWENKTGGTETDVTDPSANATYFTDTNKYYYWYKK